MCLNEKTKMGRKWISAKPDPGYPLLVLAVLYAGFPDDHHLQDRQLNPKKSTGFHEKNEMTTRTGFLDENPFTLNPVRYCQKPRLVKKASRAIRIN